MTGSRGEHGEVLVVSSDMRKIAQYMIEYVRREFSTDSRIFTKHPLIGRQIHDISDGEIVAVIITAADERTDFEEELVDGVIFTKPKVPVFL